MQFKRDILISTDIARKAIMDKSMLDSLAFAVQIKTLFESSALKQDNTTYSGLQKTFKIGYTKLRRIMSDAIKYGFIRRDGNLIIANRLYSDKDRVGAIRVTKNMLLNKEAVKHIKRIVIQDHFIQQQRNLDLYKKEQIGNMRKKTQTVRDGKLFFGGTSYKGIAKKLNCSEREAIRFMDELNNDRYLKRCQHYKTFDGYVDLSPKGKAVLAEQGHHVVFVQEIGKMCIQLPNLYFMTNKNDIRWVNFERVY